MARVVRHAMQDSLMLRLACRARLHVETFHGKGVVRPRRALAIGLLTLACICSGPLFAQTQSMANARVPVACKNNPSCGDDPTLRQVHKRHKALVRAGTALEANIDLNACDETRPNTRDWGPAATMPGGDEAVDFLLRQAGRGIPVDGELIVETAASRPDERHLARCSVQAIGDSFGPPRDCVTMAIVTPQQRWVRGATPDPSPVDGDELNVCATAAHMRPTGAIDIEFEVQTAGPLRPIADAIQRALETQLGLSVEVEDNPRSGYISIDAASGMHNSKVLSAGWREIVDFSFLLDREDTTSPVSVRGDAHLLVCRQAVSDISSYHGLSDAQRTLYARYLDSLVVEAIRTVCPRFRQVDAKTISCN